MPMETAKSICSTCFRFKYFLSSYRTEGNSICLLRSSDDQSLERNVIPITANKHSYAARGQEIVDLTRDLHAVDQ